MNKEAIVKEAFALRRKLGALEYARLSGSSAQAYRLFEIPPSIFYRWKKAFAREGEAGLIRKKPIANSHPRQIPPEVVEKILHLRRTNHLGPQRIAWYLERYHGVKTSCSSVYRTLPSFARV
jgi:transposase